MKVPSIRQCKSQYADSAVVCLWILGSENANDGGGEGGNTVL